MRGGHQIMPQNIFPRVLVLDFCCFRYFVCFVYFRLRFSSSPSIILRVVGDPSDDDDGTFNTVFSVSVVRSHATEATTSKRVSVSYFHCDAGLFWPNDDADADATGSAVGAERQCELCTNGVKGDIEVSFGWTKEIIAGVSRTSAQERQLECSKDTRNISCSFLQAKGLQLDGFAPIYRYNIRMY